MDDCDALAVARAKAGDQEAFRFLVERHSHALFRLAYRMTGTEDEAEDIVQETFLRAYRQLPRFEARSGFSTWLHRIAANCCLDFLRKRKRNQSDESFDTDLSEDSVRDTRPGPDDLLCQSELAASVDLALERLTPLERTAFVLRHFENSSIQEISDTLDLSQSAAKQAIFRAVQKVRRSLEAVLR